MKIETLNSVKSLLADLFQMDPGEIANDLAFGDLPQWDSMGHMDVMMSLEEKYAVEISAETIGELVNISAICAYIEENGRVRN